MRRFCLSASDDETIKQRTNDGKGKYRPSCKGNNTPAFLVPYRVKSLGGWRWAQASSTRLPPDGLHFIAPKRRSMRRDPAYSIGWVPGG